MDFDKYTNEYNDLISKNLKPFEKNTEFFSEYKIQLIRNELNGNPKNILDFGCGVGRSIPYLKKYFPDSSIIGCDVSDESIELASKKYQYAKFCNSNELRDFNIKFDLIFIACVFHHIEKEERLNNIKSIEKFLNINASLIIFEHNPINPITRYIVNNCPFDEDAVLLMPKELIKYLRMVRLNIRSKKYTLYFPFSLKYLQPIEKYLTKVPLGGQYFVHATKS